MSSSEVHVQSEQDLHQSSPVKKINNCFNSSKSRVDGWQLLSSHLPQCSEEDFQQFCVKWMQNCCKIDGLVKNKDCAVSLLSNLFKISSNYQELKKSVSFFITTQYFDFFFKHFLNSQAGWNCTKNCLLYYRGACGAHQDGLQKHLTAEVEKNKKISLVTAECFALLPCTGGGGNDGVNYKKNWKNQFVKILSICHSILNDLYGDAEELKLQEYETLEFTYKNTEGDKNTNYLVNLLYNYISILNCMLLNQYPAPKSIPSDLIFQLVCRGLALNPKSLSRRQTTEYMALQKVLPDIQCNFLSLLKALVVTSKNMLTPYAHFICKLVKQTLEWTEAVEGSKTEKLRIAAYESLCNWLAVAGNGSCVEGISNALLASAANDVTPKKETVSLKGKSQNKETKTRRIETSPNSNLCKAALKSLQFLLKFAGVTLQPEEHKFIQEMVVNLLLETQKNTSTNIAPFSVSKYRQELYSLLLELVHQPCTKWPPPTQFALRLFSNGLNDPSPEVSSFCSAALNLTTIIIHPHYDNGGFSAGETTVNGSQRETEVTWTEEPVQVENEKVFDESSQEINTQNENSSDSNKTDTGEKVSDASSWEDCTPTVRYSKEIETSQEKTDEEAMEVEPSEENTNAEETMEVKPSKENTEVEETMEVELSKENSKPEEPIEVQPNNEEPTPKKQKLSEPAKEQTPSPAKDKAPETPPSVRDVKTRNPSEESTQESPSELNHPKKRYFLRSKTKGSSEEPEEIHKPAGSPESVKSTPLRTGGRSTPVVQSANRPKTRARSRIETNSESETKGQENDELDEENLKAAFDDSLVD